MQEDNDSASGDATPSLEEENEDEEQDEEERSMDKEGEIAERQIGSLEDSESEFVESDIDEDIGSEESYGSHEQGEEPTSSSRVIGVGVPSDTIVAESGIPMTTQPLSSESSEEEDSTERPPQTENDANQAAVSEVVAQSIAEREHNAKMGVAKPPPLPGAVSMTPRLIVLSSGKTLDGETLNNSSAAEQGSDIEKAETSGILSKDGIPNTDDDDTGSEEIQADVGIPLVPGAFAIGGIEPDRATGWESDFDDKEEQKESSQGDPENVDPEEDAMDVTGEQAPIIGVLSNRNLLGSEDQGEEAVVLDILPEEQSSRRGLRGRLIRIGGVVGLAVVATIIVAVLVSRDGSSESSPPDNSEPLGPSGWIRVGDVLVGSTTDDSGQFGHSLSLSGNGQRVAAGVPEWDDGTNVLNVGQVRVLDWNGTDWVVSIEIDGKEAGARAGSSVSLASNGLSVAIGAPSWESDRGQVTVYQAMASNDGLTTLWSSLGNELVGDESSPGTFGSSVTLSTNGNILAVGAPNSAGAMGNETGFVRIFTLTNSTWVQLGRDIEGNAALDLFGSSVSLCDNGQRLIAGAPGSHSSSAGSGDFTGQVRVLSLEGTEWVPLGQSIYGLRSFDRFGHSVACNKAGSIIAVGVNNFNTHPGYVQVFQYNNITHEWIQMGDDLVGDVNFERFGFSVSLSADGKTLATGSPFKDNVETDDGQAEVFEYNDATQSWNKRGGDLTASDAGEGDRFGWSVSLSAGGSRLAVGAPLFDFDGNIFNVGSVEIFDAVNLDS